MKYLTSIVFVLILICGACSTAPPAADPVEATEPSVETEQPSKAKLAECPCGDPDWSTPPPGSDAAQESSDSSEN